MNHWISKYKKEYLLSDIPAGIIVAVMLVPQAMAYAMLAGLPPETGLYASILPVVAYAAFGTSNYLAVGPVAIVSVMVGSIAIGFATPGSTDYQTVVVTLALLTGSIMLVFGILGFGSLVNFLSHPVIVGFINAAALLITISQLKHLLGIDLTSSASIFVNLRELFVRLNEVNYYTLTISIVSVFLFYLSRGPLTRLLGKLNVKRSIVSAVSKLGALPIIIISILCVQYFELHSHQGVEIIGHVPSKLPAIVLPAFDSRLWLELLPGAALIAFVGYLESISVARSLASKNRQRVKPNQELFALGSANIVAALSSAYPVAGGVGRSGVNFSAGAKTQFASVITAILVALTCLFFSSFFFYLPRAILATIIILAVLNLIDMKSFVDTWRYSKPDALAMLITFFGVLSLGVENGIVAGLLVSLILYLWRTAHPHMAIVGQVAGTEHYRNELRHEVKTYPNVVALRIDESLYFANIHALEERLLLIMSDNKDVEDIILICSAINFIDSSALDTLGATAERLRDAGVTMHLAEVKGPVMDALNKVGFTKRLGQGKVFLSTHEAMLQLAQK